MKSLILMMVFAGLMMTTGCASLIGIASEEGLKRMDDDKRATYREALDTADGAIHEAKSQYDARYDVDGVPIPTDPVPAPVPDAE